MRPMLATGRQRRHLAVPIGATIGVIIALVSGLLWIGLAPDNGFADLAAASVTKVVLIPLGAVGGAIVGYRRHTR